VSRHIQEHLSGSDPVLARVIEAIGAYAPEVREEVHPFQALAHAIAHQQLNGIAANTILRRLCEACNEGPFPSPQWVLDAPVAKLRAAGFSFAKIAALKDLAQKTLTSVVPGHEVLAGLSNEDIITRLTQVRGIGRWTVEMLLMFRLGRPDVLPVDDFGVRAGFRAAYGLRKLPHPKALALYGERWKPHRTAAAWYLWRALELQRAGTLPAPLLRTRLPRVKKLRRRPKRAAAPRKKAPKKTLRKKAPGRRSARAPTQRPGGRRVGQKTRAPRARR
jgi:DNA-3-methyladenine glycosylase II